MPEASPQPIDPVSVQDCTEALIGRAPVTIRRRVIFGECDPAGVVYTPRFADYAASAFIWFADLVLRPALDNQQYGSPIKALSLEFHRILKPRDVFDMQVFVTEVRTRTFDLRVLARGLDSVPHFEARISPILVNRETFVSAPIPEAARSALLRYQQSHPPPG